jgi:protease IV
MRFLLNILAAFLGFVAAVIFLFVIIVGILASQDPTPRVENRSILVVELTGAVPETQPLDPFEEMFSGRVVTARDITRALEKAATDRRIAGVWLRPISPQMSLATASEIRRALEAYKTSGKPLIASSGTHGFSETGYFLATVADSIFTAPEAVFALNGFNVSVPFFAGTLDMLGIEPEVIRAGDYKAAAESLTERQLSPENREQYTEILRGIDETFRQTVATTRPITREQLDRIIAAGGIYTARAAHGFGLIDGMRYEMDTEAAFRALTEQDADAELRTVSLRTYARVPARDAGLQPGNRSNHVAVVYAVGTIMPGKSTGGTLGSETFVEAVQDALRNDRTRAIVVRVDSPGGSATASDAMWNAVREAAERMPVVVSMGSVAASGGYYIAAPAHAVVADANTITGSIGVISVLFDASDFLENRLGITTDTIQTGPAAGIYSLDRARSPLERQLLEMQTEQIYTTFVQRVADGRNLSPDSVRALGGGRVYTGQRAAEIGLVDELGDLDYAIQLAATRAELAEDDYRVRTYPERPPLIERLQRAFGGDALVRAWVERSMTPEERLIRHQAAMLRRASQLHGIPQKLLLEVPVVR